MANLTLDVCDLCGDILQQEKSGLVIRGQQLETSWVGMPGNADPFNNIGSFAPLDGKVRIVVCSPCIQKTFQIDLEEK